MKEYETKSIEELRADDYAANRKGPQSGAAAPGAATGGLFSAAPNQTVSSSGGLFGTTTSQPQQAGGLFGQAQQQNKSMFGTVTSAAPSFGSTFGGGTSQFGAPATSTSGGLFGAAKPAGAFGAPATTAGFAFGQQQPTQANTGGKFHEKYLEFQFSSEQKRGETNFCIVKIGQNAGFMVRLKI